MTEAVRMRVTTSLSDRWLSTDGSLRTSDCLAASLRHSWKTVVLSAILSGMTERQLRLLKEVGAGKWNHRCASRNIQELEAFQAVADDLLRLEALGYVGSCHALAETETGRHYVDRVFIRGGLTRAGREALKDHP